MKTLTLDELLSILRARVTEADSQSVVAADLHISRQTLCQLLKGHGAPGPALLRALGYRKVVMYTKVKL